MGCLAAIHRIDQQQSMQWILKKQTQLKNDQFKLYCADLLAKSKRNECLSLYVELLGAQQSSCRYRAFRSLKGMTNQSLGYEAGKGANQPEAIAKWNDYISKKYRQHQN